MIGGQKIPSGYEGSFTKAPDVGAVVPELFGIKVGPPVLDLLCVQLNCTNFLKPTRPPLMLVLVLRCGGVV